MKNCYFCGADVPDQSKFCPKCGKSIAVTQDLIERAKANDPDAQTELYERTYKTTYSRIRAKVPDEDTAMDIMQESYLNAFTHLDQLQKPETFPSWLLSIAGRQVCDWYRKNGKEKENIQMSQLEYGNDDAIPDESDILEEPEYREDFLPDESLDQVETGRLLSEILDTLPEDQRIILTMRYYDEMSLNEISEDLGVNLSTVKTRLKLGKKKVEEKVLELEKSGTKLYSLGPVAFLVYLLHHMELFAPTISANTVIGLTATGAGTTAGGTVASAAAQSTAGVTGKAAAGAAVKAAGGAALKGIGVRIAAVVAAVVVAAGITIAVIFSNNDHKEAEPTSSSEESVSDETGALAVEPPSDNTVMEMAEDLNKWIANSDLGSEQIDINLDTACELAATLVSECGYTDGAGVTRTDEGNSGGYTSEISEDALDQCLHDLFGNEYQAEDLQNSETSGMIQTDYPDYHTGLSGHLVRNEDGNLCWDYTGWEDVFADAEPADVTDISPVEGDEESCTATVRYDWYISDDIGERIKLDGSADVTFRLKYDDDSRYGWVITAVQEGPYTETDGKIVKSSFAKQAGLVTSGRPDIQTDYDINGNVLAETGYLDDGSEVYYREYTYDSNGNLLTDCNNWYYMEPITYREEFTYDDHGNMLTDFYSNSINFLYRYEYEYTYDDDGNMLTKTSYDSDGAASSRSEYTYYDNGNLLTETEYDNKGAVLIRYEYVYDSNGNLQTKNRYGSDGTISGRYEYTYDSNGNMLTETEYDRSGNGTVIEEYTYDSDGNILTHDDIAGAVNEKFTYDSDGNMLTSYSYANNDQAPGNYSYEYEYFSRFPGDFS